MTDATYTVAVRALCEFTARQGDLDLRFTPSPSAQQGIEGHRTVAARRGGAYQAELALSGEYRHLRVRGRADGYDPEQQRLEEVKTFKGDLDRLPANHRELHWAQARVYGWLLCQERGLASIDLSLVYFEIGRQQEVVLTETHSAASLREFFETLCERFLAWADQEIAHRTRRDQTLTELRFVHAQFRQGQRALAESVYKAARLGRCLMAQAPTGIGKTLGTLFPLLKACPVERLDRIFFLTAKGSGSALALAAIGTVRAHAPGLALRSLELVAREKACEHPDKACHGLSCPLARGFYDRLPAARQAAVTHAALGRDALREIALAHQICPYYLGQELARWSDVIVGDYNHFYDSSALLHALTLANQWRVAVLVDEAHNLIERGRAMHSAALAQSALAAIRPFAPAALRKPMARLSRAWNALTRDQTEPYQTHEAPPASLLAALQALTGDISERLADDPEGVDPALLRFHFDALHFSRLADSFGEHSLFDVSQDGDSVLCIRNVIPAPFLAPRHAAARTTVLFSATFSPREFYADMLGLPEDTGWIDVEAPFDGAQLSVRIAAHVSTRYHRREASLAPIARLMAQQYRAQPGNYLAFFSSHDYLARAAQAMAQEHPDIGQWVQARRMSATQNEAFLARFTEDGRGIGFAVLGGQMAEGIDLPGARLIGAFIATLGLPPYNPVNEAMRERMDAAFGRGQGHDYTYLYPGIRKVVQAAGRVIRAPSDRGCVHLIDDRFGRPEVLALLPRWWDVGGGRGAARPANPIEEDITP